jgi:hypothetical protein
MIRLRGRVRRLEERSSGGSLGEQIVRALEAARMRVLAGESPGVVTLPTPHWPPREELERQAAAGGPLARLAAARLRLWDWREAAQ